MLNVAIVALALTLIRVIPWMVGWLTCVAQRSGRVNVDVLTNPERRVVTGQLNENVRGHLNGRARLMFRPEDVRVYAEAREFSHTNVFEGMVSHTSFVGGQWRTLIALDEVRPMQILAFPAFQPQIAQHVWVEMSPERCQVVPE